MGVSSTLLTNGMADIDQRVRIAAFNWLDEQVGIHGDVLLRSILAQGFEFEGQRVPLVAPQGIFKLKLLPQFPLSIATTPEGPYDDSFGPKAPIRPIEKWIRDRMKEF